MRALVFDGGLHLRTTWPLPEPLPGEALLRTLLVGVCATDLEILSGYARFHGVLGHEFVALVEEAEDPALVGQRVVGEINIGCGTCATCQAGRPNHCPHREALGIRGRDGALADFFCLPVQNLHAVPDSIPDKAAVFVEPLAAACRILEQVPLQSGDRAIVLGDGKLGLLVAQVLAQTGCDLLAIGHHRAKLSILSERGIATRLSAEGLDTEADLVIECTGRAEGFSAARELVRPEGTLVLKSTYHGALEADWSSVVVDEVRIVGSRCGPFSPALHLLAQGSVDVASLVEAVYPLGAALTALEHASRRGALKILIRP